MNLLEATLQRDGGGLSVEFGSFRLPVPAEVSAARPELHKYEGRTIVLGIRPEDMEDASLVSDAPATGASRRWSSWLRRSAPMWWCISPSTHRKR